MPAPTGLCVAPAQPEAVQGLSPCHRGHLLSWATRFLTELRSASRTSCTTVRSYSDRIWGHKPGAARPRCAPVGAWAGLPPVPPRLPPVPQNGLLGGAWVAAGSAWGQREWRQPWAGDRSGGRAGGLGVGGMENGCGWVCVEGWRHREVQHGQGSTESRCLPAPGCIPGSGAWPRRLLSPRHSQRR